MYKCQLCGIQVPRGIRQKKLVTRKRPRVYSQNWVRVPNTQSNKDRFEWRLLPPGKVRKTRGKPRFIEVLTPVHTGWEIAEELRACARCCKLI